MAEEHQPQLEMIRTSATLVDVPALPPGYLLREITMVNEKAYLGLFHKEWPDEDYFSRTLSLSLTRGFYAAEHVATGQLVSSCVALSRWGHGLDSHLGQGVLGWLITHPDHRRRGLGTVMSALVTNRLLEEGYVEPWLGTEDFRISAIAIYLRLSWHPDLYHETRESRWQGILAQIDRA